MPVGHILKFDFEQREKHDFGMKWNFSKTRIGHVMLNFLATTENLRNERSEQLNYKRRKITKKTAVNCFSQFTDIISYWSRAVLS